MDSRKAYLFDFDGTLVDTMQGFADIAAEVINRFHPEMGFDDARKSYLDTSGAPFFQQLEIIFPGDKSNGEISEIFEETKQEGFFRSSFSDEVKGTINKLRSGGNIAGVSSNNFQELIDRFVEREGLKFDIVLGYREGFEKGREHFEHVMKRFSLNKADLTFVGDSLKDAEKADDFGINFIGICGTFKRSDFMKLRDDIITVNFIEEVLKI